MDITAAGTSAPMAMAENAKPANQLGNSVLNSAGTTSLLVPGVRCCGIGHEAEQGNQAQQYRVGRQEHGVLADGVGVLRGEDARQRVRVHEGSHRRAQRQRREGQHLRGLEREAGAPPLAAKASPAAENTVP